MCKGDVFGSIHNSDKKNRQRILSIYQYKLFVIKYFMETDVTIDSVCRDLTVVT